eukprot:TRINITY_DN3362_c0_g1_i2.p1 TRINITY_DN3362_c0_g1~~TRINITY_DN3362_c0_g1_i2.p1  ORF type:complete len:399 (-),score=6.41 TRINITY_DN3362_c0_g1_i2:349-1545(-)
MLRGPPRSPLSSSSAASDVYKRQECSIRSDLTAVGQSQTIPCALSGQLIRIENTLPNWPFNDPHVVPGASYANRMIYMISLAEITVNLAAPTIDTVPLSSKLMHLSSSYSRNRYPLSNLIDRDPLTFSRNGMYSLVDGASEFHHMRYPDWIEIDTGAVRSIASVTLTARSDLVPHACDAISETGCTLATGTLKTTKNLTMFKMLNHLFGRKGYTTEVRSQVDWCRPRGCMVGPGCSMLRHAHSDGGPALINVYYGAQKSDWQNVEQEKWWGGLTPAVRYCGIENGNISFWPDSDRDARYGADNLRVLVDGQECSIRSDLTAVGQSQTIPCALSGQLIRIENTLPNWPFNDPHVVPGASYANRMIYMISLAEITVNLAAPNIDKTHGWRQAARLGRRLD